MEDDIHHDHEMIIQCCNNNNTNTNQTHHQKQFPRKTLNFNAPLLSTRRPTIDLSSCPSLRHRNSSDRVPFSWEKAAGKPKQTSYNDDEETDTTPRPKLPPSLWQYRHLIASATATKTDVACDARNDENEVSCGTSNVKNDVSCDASNDENEVFSLSEAIDIVERSEEKKNSDGLRLRIIEDRSRDDDGDRGFPGFIIERFLPDAAALAAASLERRCVVVPAKRGFSPPKGCGLETILFPWRSGKHRLCGVRSPDVVPRGGNEERGESQIHRRHDKHKRW